MGAALHKEESRKTLAFTACYIV